MKAFATVLFLSLAASQLQAREESAAGVYRSEVGIYSLTVSLLSNGNYLARWDADIGSNGKASGSWTLVGGEVRLVPKKEEGHPMTGYLRVLLLREFEGRKVLIRKEDAVNDNNPYFYLYLQKPNKSPQRNAGSGPATLDGASPPRPALSSEETARPRSPRG
jgi:hypothetical protein